MPIQEVRRLKDVPKGEMPLDYIGAEELPPEVHVTKIKSELKMTSKEFNKTDKKLIERKE
jgi:hypothetical protein